MSGLDSQDCQSISDYAWNLAPSTNTLKPTIIDHAGDDGTTPATFLIKVDTASLCRLMDSAYVTTSNGAVNQLCNDVQHMQDQGDHNKLTAAGKLEQFDHVAKQVANRVGKTMYPDTAPILLKFIKYWLDSLPTAPGI